MVCAMDVWLRNVVVVVVVVDKRDAMVDNCRSSKYSIGDDRDQELAKG